MYPSEECPVTPRNTSEVTTSTMTDSGLNEIKKSLKDKTIHVIPYCHGDYAWIHPRKWHVGRYKRIMDEVLDVMEENPSYTWMTDNILHMQKPYYEDSTCRFEELTTRINEGRIEVTNSMMSLLRPTTAGQETFIRNIVHGRKWLLEHGISCESRVFHSVDVSIGHSQLPQLLVLSGYEYYRGWRPQGALDAKGIPREFIWKGIDGSEILCSRGTYAGLWKTGYLDRACFRDDDGTLSEFYEKELRDIINHNMTDVIWLPFGMDDTLPMRDFSGNQVNLDAFMEYLNNTSGVRIKYSTAERYFKSIPRKRLGLYEGILDPCDVAYNIPTKGDKGLWHYRSVLETLITRAEVLWTMVSSYGSKYPEDEIDLAWENLLFISGHAMEYTFSEDYEEILGIARDTVKSVDKLILEALGVLSGLHSFPDGTILLVNPTERERKGICSLFTRVRAMGNVQLTDQCQRPVDFQVIDESEILVDASIPGFGVTAISINPCKDGSALSSAAIITPENMEIDTGLIKAVFSDGYIKEVNGLCFDLNSVFGKLGFTEIIPSAEDAWLHNHRHGRYHEFVPSGFHFIETGPLRWKYRITGSSGPANAAIDITLSKGSAAVGFDVILDCRDKSNGFFSVSFPSDTDPDIKAGIPFGYEARPVSNEPYGKQTDIEIDNLERMWPGLFYGNGWASYKYKETEFSIIGELLPSYYWYDGETRSVSVILTRTFDLTQCEDWMNRTHRYMECLGKSHLKFSVLVSERFEYPRIFDFYKRTINPPEYITTGKALNDTGEYAPPIEIKSDFCFVSALYMEQEETILRIFNSAGKPDKVKIVSKRKINRCRTVDLRNKPIAIGYPLVLGEFFVSTTLRRHEVLTLSLVLSQESD